MNDFYKKEIERMLSELGLSKSIFKKNLPRMKSHGKVYQIAANGAKPSLKQQWMFLSDIYKLRQKERENSK